MKITHQDSRHQANPALPTNPMRLGTGFVPKSPQLTAEMMAGPKAQQAAQKALSQQLPLAQQSSKSQIAAARTNERSTGR